MKVKDLVELKGLETAEHVLLIMLTITSDVGISKEDIKPLIAFGIKYDLAINELNDLLILYPIIFDFKKGEMYVIGDLETMKIGIAKLKYPELFDDEDLESTVANVVENMSEEEVKLFVEKQLGLTQEQKDDNAIEYFDSVYGRYVIGKAIIPDKLMESFKK